MKRAAFYLLSGVIAFQLVIVAGVLVACFRTEQRPLYRRQGQ